MYGLSHDTKGLTMIVITEVTEQISKMGKPFKMYPSSANMNIT